MCARATKGRCGSNLVECTSIRRTLRRKSCQGIGYWTERQSVRVRVSLSLYVYVHMYGHVYVHVYVYVKGDLLLTFCVFYDLILMNEYFHSGTGWNRINSFVGGRTTLNAEASLLFCKEMQTPRPAAKTTSSFSGAFVALHFVALYILVTWFVHGHVRRGIHMC